VDLANLLLPAVATVREVKEVKLPWVEDESYSSVDTGYSLVLRAFSR